MTVKSTVSFTDRHHDFAHKKVKEGVFASVSSMVAAGIEQIMQDEVEREMVLEAMKDSIKRRMKTPREDWVEVDASDGLFDKAKARLRP
ncbi:MAG: hypothetical protein KZQ88_14540 [Candidatus Thiodiazotropha sp. (ex Dulcina madagascariensis)]|nr:hypothetical protein [Candidatus Thiodiazotropha sp. (ex Dulcina madagascariensis)]MCU7927679.1 hypothetical protein [Candidatus Thiodiazotropha sp. (ex Dulcina madagascariensis)]